MNGEHQDSGMVMVETNLDDMPGEWMGYVLDLLFENGAKDAYYTPIYMKKNRPAQKLSVLVAACDLEKISSLLFRETTTLGVRYYSVTCHRLEREFIQVDLGDWGKITVKIGKQDGNIVQIAPEYEDCAKVARLHKVPLKHVYDKAKEAYLVN
ncbi:nickel insertion protein [Ammoniphilus sp. 3BR4]|uniref:nickel insertion protein n=1 Tax=Ammoniphilus sp. 3BR4 TaxID=3158265 RepID=UPI003467A228